VRWCESSKAQLQINRAFSPRRSGAHALFPARAASAQGAAKNASTAYRSKPRVILIAKPIGTPMSRPTTP
jgi:hypothetical protein